MYLNTQYFTLHYVYTQHVGAEIKDHFTLNLRGFIESLHLWSLWTQLFYSQVCVSALVIYLTSKQIKGVATVSASEVYHH